MVRHIAFWLIILLAVNFACSLFLYVRNCVDNFYYDIFSVINFVRNEKIRVNGFKINYQTDI